ncbi:MAG: isopentenyl phosphate kinase [archaeon]
MNNLVMIKLGGSVITDKSKPFTERKDVIQRLAREIHEARQEKEISLIVGHGGGSYPHRPASEYQTQKGIINEQSYRGIAEVQDAAARLNRIVVSALIKEGENAVSIQPSAACIARNSRVTEWYTKPLEKLLEYKMLPVPYGDVAIDTDKGCCILSTEELLNYLSKKMKPKNVIVAGEVDGVFTADPHKDKDAEIIPEITRKNFDSIRHMLGGSASTDVTGGMLHKVEELVELAGHGIQSQIINALEPNRIRDALLGKKVVGTIIK